MEPQPFKNYFDRELAVALAERIGRIHPDFPKERFIEQVAAGLEPLELKGRVALIAAALRTHLPTDYPAALESVLGVLAPPHAGGAGIFNDSWYVLPLAAFVEYYGLEHFDASMAALHAITQRNTAEFAIRPFLLRYPERTLALLRRWAGDESEHVRRLVSEGTRPRLPWATRLPAFMADPTPVLELLELLRHDPAAYVRRSVANNFNDIAKDHPELVLATLERWSMDASDETRWIIRHALRTLVKQGHPKALQLLGAGQAQVQLDALRLTPDQLAIGAQLNIDLLLTSTAPTPQRLIVDYVLHFVGANGALRPKVFKLRTLDLAAGASVRLTKRHSFRPVTIRRYYPGLHRVAVQVNGATLGTADFALV